MEEEEIVAMIVMKEEEIATKIVAEEAIAEMMEIRTLYILQAVSSFRKLWQLLPRDLHHLLLHLSIFRLIFLCLLFPFPPLPRPPLCQLPPLYHPRTYEYPRRCIVT